MNSISKNNVKEVNLVFEISLSLTILNIMSVDGAISTKNSWTLDITIAKWSLIIWIDGLIFAIEFSMSDNEWSMQYSSHFIIETQE